MKIIYFESWGKMRKVIIISTVGLIYDGITNVILSYLEAMDKHNLEIFVASTIKSEPNLEKKIKKMGCTIVYLPSRKTETVKYFFALQKFMRKNEIDVIHAHGNSATLAIEMLAGVMSGCKKRIAHSHNTKCDQVKIDKMLRPLFNLLYTDSLACGEAAGKWLFNKKKFTILNNGRDINKYLFSPGIRSEIRKTMEFENSIVIGHVGGFFEQKNHRFLVSIFREILEICPDAILILIGDGPVRKEIELTVDDIKKHVIFTGTVDNVSDYLQASDGMLLPSLFEGLPLVTIEWQINGLPCLISDTITKECKLTSDVKMESLNESPRKWAEDMLEMINDNRNNREKNSITFAKIIQSKGFDIHDNAKMLRNLYLS